MTNNYLQSNRVGSRQTFIGVMSLCNVKETVAATTTTTVLKGLLPDTLYTVSLVPVYEVGDGQKQSENGKTSKTVCNLSLKIFKDLLKITY